MKKVPMNDLKTTILDKIHTGEVAMRPRWHFVLKGALLFLGVLILALWLVYLESFIVFTLSSSGVILIPAFGLNELLVFLFALPWLLIAATVVFVVVLEILVQQYSFGYRKPLVYTVLGILGVTAIGTVILVQTPVHDLAMQRARENRLPLIGPMYTGYGINPRENIHVGEVLEITNNGFRMNERARGVLVVVFDARTKTPPPGKEIKVGDYVMVLGTLRGDIVTAKGVMHFMGKMFTPLKQLEDIIETEGKKILNGPDDL